MYRKTNLIHYLPDFLREYEEYKVIAAVENDELDTVKNAMKSTLKNCFLQTCDTETALKYFENLYGKIYEAFNFTWTYEQRRSNCLRAIHFKLLPTTEAFLDYFFKWHFENLVSFTVDYANYTLSVTIIAFSTDRAIFDAWVNSYLRAAIPANMVLTHKYDNTYATLERYTHAQLSALTQEELGSEV